MAEDLTKKAAEMLLKGATLLSEPCPYCKGVRVIKDGRALCVSCGSRPEERKVPRQAPKADLKSVLEAKMQALTEELQAERDHKKQQEILESVNSVLEALDKIRGKR